MHTMYLTKITIPSFTLKQIVHKLLYSYLCQRSNVSVTEDMNAYVDRMTVTSPLNPSSTNNKMVF